jgi:hypothetical protein
MLWNDYVAEFGSSDTLGFSIIADSAHVGQVSLGVWTERVWKSGLATAVRRAHL